MSNVSVINWDKIRADYVMGTDYPTFDELSKRHKISKPLIIEKANDLQDAINRGKSWVQQRADFIEKKQTIQQDVAVEEAKSAVKNFVKILNNVGLKSFRLINRELDFLDKQQMDAIVQGKHYDVRKYVRLSDLTKIAEVLYKLSGAESSREMLVRLDLVNTKLGKDDKVELKDLSDEQLYEIEMQMKNGGSQIIDQSEEQNGTD